MKVLVTGGAGFIGHHLVARLLEDGHDVRVLDNFSTGRRERLSGADIELVEGDLRSYERVHTAVRGVETVFHLGAMPSVPRSIQDPLTSNAVNVDGTLHVLLASRDEDVRRVVFTSSSSIYGSNPALPKSELDLPMPVSPYGVSKLAAEHHCAAFNAVYGLETVALRLFNVFGPRQDPLSQYAAVVPRFISAMLRGEQPQVYGDGEQSRDFTFVADVVSAFVQASVAPDAAGLAFNISCGEETSILDLVTMLNGIIGTSIEPHFEPARDGEVRHSMGDGSQARAVLDWNPEWTVASGLREAVIAYRDAGDAHTPGVELSASRLGPSDTDAIDHNQRN